MSDKEQNKINDSRDELLKSALSVNLSKELPTKEEEQQRHAFSVDFAIRIKDLIGDADKIIEENQNAVSAAAETGEKTESRSAEIDEVPVETAETTARTSETDGKSGEETSAETEKITAEPEEQTETEKEPIAETDETAAEETEAADRTATKTGRGRSRAEAAQERMTGQVIPASFLRRHRKAIVNAASLVLVFGIGVFFLKEGGALLGGGSEANKAAAQSEQETPAVSEDTAEGGQEQRPLTETAADTGNSQPAANSAEENDLPETVSDRTAERSVSDAGGQAETTGRTAEPQEAAAMPRTQSETEERSQSSGETQNRTGESSRSRTAQSGTRKQSGKTQSSSRNTGSGTNGRTNSSTDGTAAETQGSQSKTAGKAANETGTAPSGMAGGTTAGTVPNEAAAGNVTKETAAAGNNQGQQSSAADETNAVGGVQLPNPIRKISGPEEFAKQLGFSLSVYPTAAERTDTEYSLISNKTAQICYYSETIDSKMVFRAEKKETLLADLPEQERKPGEAELGEDVWRMLSGIYYPFDESRTEFWTVKGENGEPDIPITVRIVESEESSGALATWEKDGVLYTLWAEDASRHRNAVGKEAKNLIELADVQSPSV